MTQVEIEKLTSLIHIATDAKPTLDAEEFMMHHWRPFVNTLPVSDRRMAWQLYMKAQVNHLHFITAYLQTLPAAKIQALAPALEKFVSISAGIRNLGEEPVSA